MEIRTARNGDIEIAYECFCSPNDPPIVLLAGIAMQMVMWPVDLCTALADRGLQVVRMDYRDYGLSTKLTHYDDLPWYRRGRAYTLWDVADDVIAVVDALGHGRAHLLGASVGGAVAQVTAIRHPDRVASLALLFPAPGSLRPLHVTRPNLRTFLKVRKVMRGVSPDADAEGQRWVDLFHLLGSPAYPSEDDHWRAAGRVAFERGVYPPGLARQGAALLSVGDLRPRLAALTMPTLVVQGRLDQFASWRTGRMIADAIPGARFRLFDDMGHALPRALWPTVLDDIAALTAEPDAATA